RVLFRSIIRRDSPNHGPRPAGVAPSLIVVHGTAGRTDAGDVDWCTQPESQVSYHYIVGRDGTLYALVPEDRRAWHAGRSEWEGRQNVNRSEEHTSELQSRENLVCRL